MSYYGIKNLSIVKNENGYNVKCEYYDSSIRDYDYNRVWHKSEKFLNKDFQTRTELEYELFKEFLNGNFHTSSGCGKFQCLSWTNNQISLSQEQYNILNKLEDNYCNRKYPSEVREKLRQVYYNTRYKYYFKAWQEYLEDKKKYKNNKFIIQLDAQGYKNIFIKGMGTRRIKYTYYNDEAKVFSGNPELILNKLKAWNNQSNIREVKIEKR